MNQTAVLIGIVTRNRAEILSKAIRSALAQTGRGIAVAVLDDASTDATPTLRKQYPDTQWITWREHKGYMEARNYLMGFGREDYFVSLDDDAWFLEGDEVSVAVAHLQRNPSVAAVAFDILSPDQPTSRPRGLARPVGMFIGCGHVIRLAAARTTGYYESLPGPYGGEEKDMSLRLLDAGYRIDFLPGVHVWHDKSNVARKIPEQHRSGVCNDLVMTLRRTPLALLMLALPVKVWRHFRFSQSHGLLGPFIQGVGLFLRSIPAVIKSRRAVKSSTLRHFMSLTRQANRSTHG